MTATLRAAGTPALDRLARAECDAFDWCRHYARRHDENFTVVSWFLPRALRRHFFALYAFCRATDDLGDEAPGDRLALLDAWEADLRRCFAGQRVAPLFVALGRTIETFAIPHDLFLRLIEANRIDQRRQRFETFADLLEYCSYSATPVGRMVLHVLGYRDERRLRLADATCIGLQLANFWQDVSVDLARGRIYLPIEDLRRFGCGEDDLRAGRAGPNVRRLLQFEVARARECFARGRELEALVARSVRADVSLFRRGGEAVLDAIEAARYDVLARRPRVTQRRKAWLALSLGIRMKLGL
ncbi:MAG TPA: squalene synthase HpnC [Dehalococcoidia bacterium]|nr:squalene synthase HpnC [Dehalococcoidia bacterium]